MNKPLFTPNGFHFRQLFWNAEFRIHQICPFLSQLCGQRLECLKFTDKSLVSCLLGFCGFRAIQVEDNFFHQLAEHIFDNNFVGQFLH